MPTARPGLDPRGGPSPKQAWTNEGAVALDSTAATPWNATTNNDSSKLLFGVSSALEPGHAAGALESFKGNSGAPRQQLSPPVKAVILWGRAAADCRVSQTRTPSLRQEMRRRLPLQKQERQHQTAKLTAATPHHNSPS